MASSELRLPYYHCVHRADIEKPEAGVCSFFSVKYLPIKDPAALTDRSVDDLCASEKEMTQEMSMAYGDWSTETCRLYVTSFVNYEMRSRERELSSPGGISPAWDPANTTLDEVLMKHYQNLDAIVNWTEGNIWRLRPFGDSDEERATLEAKRRCLLTSLAAAVPPIGGRIAEIGFNAGHSAATILSALPQVSLTSFDICSWSYGQKAHAHLVEQFGAERTQLVCGDSAQSVPAYASDRNNPRFDAIFIDGGHLYPQALLDIRQARDAVKPGGLVIVDDCNDVDPSTKGFEEYREVAMAWRHSSLDFVTPNSDVCASASLCIGHYAGADSEPSPKEAAESPGGGGGGNDGVVLTFRSPNWGAIVDWAPASGGVLVDVEMTLADPGDRAADLVRKGPGRFKLCSAATRLGGVDGARLVGLEAGEGLPRVPLPSPSPGAAWDMEAWLEVDAASASRVPRQYHVLGLASITVLGA
eukprot:CAMPEP_0172610922 /NCGR_PEP_ID=MMETSP1068-20121228/30665_1 /TAXON_ID=35684 /ORGANISM="Pseudopedinella elastica, Strain CCMP716" /LENGTH=471 /DNA_ID=CAMNT_0013414753 /DNA_START=90 /DNA_END=1506 /DNA_ORIENTATION=+